MTILETFYMLNLAWTAVGNYQRQGYFCNVRKTGDISSPWAVWGVRKNANPN
jgi:hypothetical protein